MIRGIERRQIFRNNNDRNDYLERLDRLFPEEGWRCFAWALMPNHVHLVIQSSHGGLSRLMARLNTGYARSFNLRHDRVGYLFQNRFKSRPVEDEADMIGLVAYVIRNPLVANLARSPRDLERYPWCNLGSLLGRTPARLFEAPEACLSFFADDRDTARTRLRTWIATSDSESELNLPCPDIGSPGKKDRTVEKVPAEPAKKRTFIPAGIDPGTALDRLVQDLARDLGISKEAVLSPGRHGPASEARSLIAAAAVDELGLNRHEIGKTLNISATAVTKAAQRGRRLQQDSGTRGKPALLPLQLSKG
jgi:REP element-mobilizing transposase RayT